MNLYICISEHMLEQWNALWLHPPPCQIYIPIFVQKFASENWPKIDLLEAIGSTGQQDRTGKYLENPKHHRRLPLLQNINFRIKKSMTKKSDSLFEKDTRWQKHRWGRVQKH